MKKSIIISIVAVVFLLIIVFLVYKVQVVNKKYLNNQSIFCVSGDNTNKVELYIDFKDGIAYRYSQVLTNKIDNSFDLEGYRAAINTENQKYKGVVAKIWNDDKIRIITENFNLNELSESEMKELTSISIKELKSKNRAEIIEILTAQNPDLKCK